MDQTLTGTVRGNQIVLDEGLSLPDGQLVEILVRPRQKPSAAEPGNLSASSPPAWWTEEDDRILEEIYQSRKLPTRREITE